ncbi:hypothetical protein [Streptosporangium longisporum]|uniref:Secreted protein n=1 Tax=Streptosporangium longisporum TaxID=46187 RepID=A0ABP6KT68_9ACTN
MRVMRRLGTMAAALAVPFLVVLMSDTATAEAIRIANHCEPPLDAD